ncbi:uncharacterized protein KZ484_003698 [Pholidichthys leucotaenia]
MDEHKGHEAVPAAAERAQKHKELNGSQQKLQQRIQDQEKEVKIPQKGVKAKDKQVSENDVRVPQQVVKARYKEPYREKDGKVLQQEVKERNKQLDRENDVRVLQQGVKTRDKQLQRKKDGKVLQQEAKARNKQLDSENDVRVLQQVIKTRDKQSDREENGKVLQQGVKTKDKQLDREKDGKVLQQEVRVRDKQQSIQSEKWKIISRTEEHTLPSSPKPKLQSGLQRHSFKNTPPEPKTRDEFLKYSSELTLDPNTAHKKLLLTEGNRKATLMRDEQFHSPHPDRFSHWWQALSRESLNGRCYWEVEWRGRGVCVVVAYKSISRVGELEESRFGWNDKSWSFFCDRYSYKFRHNKVQTRILGPGSSRVGVFLDQTTGILSFYSISEIMTLLHRVQTTFTQPLYAGLWLPGYIGDTAEFNSPLHRVQLSLTPTGYYIDM